MSRKGMEDAAHTGEEVLATLGEEGPDLFILEVKLPDDSDSSHSARGSKSQ